MTTLNTAAERFLIDAFTGELPIVELVGQDGNAFSIIGRVARAWKRLHRADIAAEFTARATAADYNHVLRMAMQYSREEDVELDDSSYDEDEEEEARGIYEDEDEDEEDTHGWFSNSAYGVNEDEGICVDTDPAFAEYRLSVGIAEPEVDQAGGWGRNE